MQLLFLDRFKHINKFFTISTMLLSYIEYMFLLATWWILFGRTIAQDQLCSTEVPNGKVASHCSRQPGSVCNVSCDSGYRPSADVKSVTCGNNGIWTFTSTACVDPIKDNFMLVVDSTDNTVYQISLMDQSVQRVGVKSTKRVTGVIYSPVDDVLIFGEGQELSIMHLNGTIKTVFSVSYYEDASHTPNRFAVDYSTGNIYYTANIDDMITSLRSFINVLSPNGKDRSILGGLNDPTGLVVYPSKGLLFYTEGRDGPLIGQVTMDGMMSSIILNLNDEQPIDLTIDYKNEHLYYIEGYTQSVKYCTIDGSNHGTLVRYHGNSIGAIFLYQEHLYMTLNATSGIIKLNISNPNDQTKFADHGELGKINFISIYSSTDLNKNAFCSVDNGGCSTFCLPSSDGGTCGCEDHVELKEGSDKVCSENQPEEDY